MDADAQRRHHAVVRASFGALGVRMHAGALCAVDYLPRHARTLLPAPGPARRVADALACYLRDPRLRWGFPLTLDGTPFQRRVWQALRRIPPGRVLTYGELARRLGSSPRAVGAACRANPIPIVIPCHRVVSRAGIGGYGGATSGARVALKTWLLRHEGVHL